MTRWGVRAEAVRQLENHGYAYNKSANGTRLQQLVKRAERGLISYEKRTSAELRQFCHQRNLILSNSDPKKAMIIAILETADDNPRFEAFTELPAELRVHIYELVIQAALNSWSTQWSLKLARSQPPVSRASRLLRHEALPVFYDIARFHIAGRIGLHDPSGHSTPDGHMTRMLQLVPSNVFSQFKMLHLQISGFTGAVYAHFCWEIDLVTNGKQHEVRCTSDGTSYSNRENARSLRQQAETRIEKVLEQIATREGGNKLQNMDMEALCRAVKFADGI